MGVGVKQRLMPPAHWDWHTQVPLSQGWHAGDFVYVGGQVSADEHGNPLGVGDIEIQTRNVFENITKVLREAGADWTDVIKLNTYYVCNETGAAAREYWERMTRIRLEYLPDPGPAATAVRVAGLMYDELLIEADVVAYLGARRAPGNGGRRAAAS
jgi:enamine deaminase RidA (YjgF/YER057c/UK114 family)